MTHKQHTSDVGKRHLTKKNISVSNALVLSAVHSGNGSLERYIHTVNSVPMFSAERENSLVECQQKGDLETAKQFILSHLCVVVPITRGHDGYGLNQTGLTQKGDVGPMKVAKRYEPSHSVRPFSFAIHRIRAGVHGFILHNWRLMHVAITKPQRKLLFNLRSMCKNLNALSPKETWGIAGDLGVKLSEVLEMEQCVTNHDTDIMADNSDDKDSFTPTDWLADHDAELSRQLVKQAYYALQAEGLQNALAQLDDRSRRIVESRWLQDDGGLTLRKLTDEYGVSTECVHQIEAKTMQKLRGFLAEGAATV